MSMWMFVLGLVLLGSLHAGLVPLADYQTLQVLERFYVSTNGPLWNTSRSANSWNFSKTGEFAYLSDPCRDSWFGVSCNATATVVALQLVSSNLSGTVPTSIGLLTGLTSLLLNINHLVGSIPSELGNLSGLQILDLYSNCLTGKIPTQLGSLTGLQKLELNINSLSGPLPSELGKLLGLQCLDVDNNILTGRLPSELGLMSALSILDLSTNRIIGSMPSELSKLTGLQFLSLYNNNIVGSLTSELGLMTGLSFLFLYMNHITGFLPSDLGKLTGLKYLLLQDNRITGSLPTQLARLKNLQRLKVFSNSLSGTLPTEFGRMSALQILDLYGNFLTGKLPTQIGNMTDLWWLCLSSNSLTGKLPTVIGNLTRLKYLYLSSNRLSGSLITEIGLLSGLRDLYLYNSNLVGKLPTELWQLTALKWLVLYKNNLSGTLPTEIGLMSSLQGLDLYDNKITGSLPKEIGTLSKLQYLHFSSNKLTRSVPSELGLLKKLEILSFFSNCFEGSLPKQLLALDKLIVLDVHDNSLHGQLPSKLPPNMAVLSLAKNCFTGTLAPSLCDAKNLQHLILDGLSAGDACQTSIWPGHPFGFNALKKNISGMSGSIPSCLYSLPKLKTLHVSGNGLRGSLQAGPAGWSASLTDLSLSHNALTGEIPPSLKLRLGQLATLDLSYNRLRGTLGGFPSASSNKSLDLFSLELNRLSGRIPPSVLQMKGGVLVLIGNLFDCSWHDRRARLPAADPAYSEYICSSHSIDVYLYAFVSFIALLAASYCLFQSNWRPMYFWLSSRNKAALEALQRRPVSIEAVLYRLRSLTGVAGAVLLLVFVPLYGALKQSFGTYEFQYSWTVAAIMLSGTAPAAVLLVSWTLTLAATSASIVVWFRDLKGSETTIAVEAALDARNVPTWSERGRLSLRLVIIVVFNLAVSGAANIAFLLATVGNYNNDFKSLATVALGLYKSMWSIVLTVIIDSEFLRFGVDTAVEEQSKFLKAGDLFRTLLQIVNAVVMPAFGVAVTDPMCYKHSLYAAPSIRSSYNYPYVIPATFPLGAQTVPVYALIEFTPAFSYNHECTSTLVEKFAPVFAQVALTTTFVFPVVAVGARWALDSMQSRGLGDRLPGLRSVLLAILPSLLLYRKSEREAAGPKTFIKADEVLRQSVTDVALMLSIGLVAPLLGLLFAASIASRCLMWEFAIDRFLSLPDEHIEGDLHTLEKQCLQLGSLGNTALYNARWLLAIFPSLFLALFVSDIAGDKAGIENALWAPILMSLLPSTALFLLTRLLPAASATLPENNCSDTKRDFFAPSLGIAPESAPVAGNPLHKAALSPNFELVELRDHIPESNDCVPPPPRRL